jgi:uncharacterized protein YecT (DUF1311 family)
MKSCFLFSLLIGLSVCSYAQTQSQMNQDAAKSFQKADKELNDVYKKILIEYKEDTLFIKNLKISQRLWVQFKKAEMDMKYPNYSSGYYGSVQPMCELIYEEQLTKDRIKTLKVRLTGIEEGDVCSGSVKTKH